jgi:hypothetical protein
MIKRFFITGLILIGLLAPQLIAAPSVHAGLFDNAKQEACGGAQLNGAGADCAQADTSSLDNTIKVVINILSVIVGIVAVIVIIISGMKLAASGGDSNKISSAKNGIIFALIGLVVVALAQFIVKYVLNKL